jgi:YspA, cpYpsA-related SLOG family
MYRVLITGSRDWDDPAEVWQVLDDLEREHGVLLVIHGRCPTGADFHAHMWVARRQGRTEKGFRPNWRLLGRAAGPARNTAMVTYGADECVAFFQPGAANAGTLDCSSKAEAAGIPVTRKGQQ